MKDKLLKLFPFYCFPVLFSRVLQGFRYAAAEFVGPFRPGRLIETVPQHGKQGEIIKPVGVSPAEPIVLGRRHRPGEIAYRRRQAAPLHVQGLPVEYLALFEPYQGMGVGFLDKPVLEHFFRAYDSRLPAKVEMELYGEWP